MIKTVEATQKSSEQILKEMDAAALTAEKEIPTAQAKVVGAWIKKHYAKAGYKRLAKLLIARAQ